MSTLSLLNVIGFSNGLETPPLWDLNNFLNYGSFSYPNFASSARKRIKNSVKIPPTEEAWIFERSGLGHSLIIVWILKPGCLSSVDFRVILNILEVGLL